MGWGTRLSRGICTSSIFKIGVLVYFSLAHSARVAHADLLRVHAISPPRSTDWSSPKSLLKSTITNSVRSTYSPSGHILIHLETQAGSIMTSMASARRTQTFSLTVIKQLGLSSLYYDFEGTLDSVKRSQDLVRRARRDQRLATLEIEMTSEQGSVMRQFLERWIRSGAYRHYRGGEIASRLNGAGCADFVMWFLNVATQGRAPLQSWMRELHLPLDLLSETRPDEILKRDQWAKPGEGRFFMIPDPELIVNWIRAFSASGTMLKIGQGDLDQYFAPGDSHFSSRLIAEAGAAPSEPEIDEAEFQAIWSKIRVTTESMPSGQNRAAITHGE